MADLTGILVEMQNSQMERAQSRTEELLLKMETVQRKLDEESRRMDQEFFLHMAELCEEKIHENTCRLSLIIMSCFVTDS